MVAVAAKEVESHGTLPVRGISLKYRCFEDGILWVPLLWDLELLTPLVHMCSDTSLIYAKVIIEWSPKET